MDANLQAYGVRADTICSQTQSVVTLVIEKVIVMVMIAIFAKGICNCNGYVITTSLSTTEHV